MLPTPKHTVSNLPQQLLSFALVVVLACFGNVCWGQTQESGSGNSGEIVIPGGDTCENPLAPVDMTPTANLTVCIHDNTQLTAMGAGTLFWYTTATGGTPIDSGTTFATGSIDSVTTFYVESQTCKASTRTAITVSPFPVPSISIYESPSGLHCSGQYVSLTANGGVFYNWSGGVINGYPFQVSSSNVYSVTVTDSNGCTHELNTSLDVAPSPSLTLNESHVICHGESTGAVYAAATSGTGPYTYQWSNNGTGSNQTALTAGTYTVTLTDSLGCTAISSAVVAEPSQPVSIGVLTVEHLQCHGDSSGSISVSATGGTGSISFLWNNGIAADTVSNLPSGTYTMTATDANGCTALTNVLVTEPAEIQLSISSVDIACYGHNTGSLSATATNGQGSVSYLWSNGSTSAQVSSMLAGVYTLTVTDSNGCSSVDSIVLSEPADSLSAVFTSVQPVLCHGDATGAIHTSGSGGTGDLSYSWNQGGADSNIVGLQAGVYTLVITDDNGCSYTMDTVIREPETPVNIGLDTLKHVRCYGDSTGGLIVFSDGGTGQHQYMWNNGMTMAATSALPAGSYTITVTDEHGCTSSTTVEIEQPESALGTVTTTLDVLCFGESNGMAKVLPVGGTPPYAFAWSHSSDSAVATNLTKGIYHLTITDENGCEHLDSAVIEQPDAILLEPYAVPALCNGENSGEAEVTVSGGVGGYTYEWSNGKKSASAGRLTSATYTVTVTDSNGCTKTEAVYVHQPAPIQAFVETAVDTAECEGKATIEVNGGNAPYTYLWNDPLGQNTQTAVHLCPGSYCVSVSDANGCMLDSCEVLVTRDKYTPTNDYGFFIFYPNPNNGQFFIEYSSSDPYAIADVTVFDMLGKPVWVGRALVGRNPVSMEKQASGTYLIQLTSEQGSLHQKLVIR